jgi:2-oxoisovalerate dehydrogenase E1 component alpha subunit
MRGIIERAHASGRSGANGEDPVNIMDLIMFEAQRQGRLSFYMVYLRLSHTSVCCEGQSVLTSRQVSAGEEGIAVGSASALTEEDVIFCQYREAGVFQQRGFTLKQFMSQLFANKNDPGRGRNMPVHYGLEKPRIVRHFISDR